MAPQGEKQSQGGDKQPPPSPRLLLVEAEPWEQADLVHECSHGCQVYARSERLQDVPDHDIPPGVTVLSVFIHSHVDARQLDRLPDLRFIATRSTGYEHIDLAACSQRGITVSNVPDYGDTTVAEHTFALLLALTRRIPHAFERTIRGDFSLDGLRGQDIAGKTFGCLGTGKIGTKVLRIARGFDMQLLAFDARPDERLAREIGFEYVELPELLRRSDVLSIHVPYNPRTHHLIDERAIAAMPRGAILINTARGGIVDQQALIMALLSGHLGGAALDVLEGETAIGEEAEILSRDYDVETLQTIVRNHALLRMPNVIITPHVAFNSQQAIRRIIDTTVANIHDFLTGRPSNVVS